MISDILDFIQNYYNKQKYYYNECSLLYFQALTNKNNRQDLIKAYKSKCQYWLNNNYKKS